MKERDKDSKAIHKLVDAISTTVDGANMGHLIPALIYILALTHDEAVLAEEEFIKNVAGDLSNWFSLFRKTEDKGETQWLQ